MRSSKFLHSAVLVVVYLFSAGLADDLKPQRLQSNLSSVQPMTGIALWTTNEAASTAPIQLEYAYLKYSQIVQESGVYDWEPVERLLTEVAGRKHQAILRWHDTYVGEPTGVPDYIKRLPNYHETAALSEKKQTGFPDWSNPEWKAFVLQFYTRFAEKYDADSRLAFVQTGFGLWAEYHIYDGPMKLGQTFPDKEFQLKFLKHLASNFQETPWMISVDAAGDHTPFAKDTMLSELQFGLFDDSFIGDDQPRFQSPEVIRNAGMACGYRFKVNRFLTSSTASELEIENTGIAPIYYHAYPAVDGVRSGTTLKGLEPGQRRQFRVAKGGALPVVTIECDRLVPGQKIGFEADLP